jgi:hypothetical protein
MEDQPKNGREFLGRLAREYGEKLSRLEELVKDSPRDRLLPQLQAQGGLAIDRFRSAQMFLFNTLTGEDELDRMEILKAATALSRCFDELNILFNFLLENSSDEQCGK